MSTRAAPPVAAAEIVAPAGAPRIYSGFAFFR